MLLESKELCFSITNRVSLPICKNEPDFAGSSGIAADEVAGAEGSEANSQPDDLPPPMSGFSGQTLLPPTWLASDIFEKASSPSRRPTRGRWLAPTTTMMAPQRHRSALRPDQATADSRPGTGRPGDSSEGDGHGHRNRPGCAQPSRVLGNRGQIGGVEQVVRHDRELRRPEQITQTLRR